MIDIASAAAVVTAANRCHVLLTARIEADPDAPIVGDLRILADRAFDLAAEYTNLIAWNERRTA